MSGYCKKADGYVALIAVLIAGALGLAVSVALLLAGTDSQRSALVVKQSAKASSAAKSCIEEAMQQIRFDHSYTGSGLLELNDSDCQYDVTDVGSEKDINATGQSGSVVKKVQARVTITLLSISIASWQEVD
ncbi:MAG: hypothetical protein PVI21_01115 [Candidatus Woesebacteria bacterium]|jgi:hypothetical protein